MTDTLRVHPGTAFRGQVEPPGDKSISHRALLFAGLAHGQSRLTGINAGEDCARTRAALEQLGARYHREGDALRVDGAGEPEPGRALEIDCGNSGTTLRVLSGALAGYPITATYSGDESLSRRPVARVVEPLRLMGAQVSAAEGDRLPPLKSCVLMAGLRAAGETEVTETALSRDHTERMLPHWGVVVRRGGGPGAHTASVSGGARLSGADFDVPRDPSAALFWVVAALLVPGAEVEIRNLGLNPARTGALEVLRRMGAHLEFEPQAGGSEPRGTLRARHSRLRGADIAPGEIPSLLDELPALAVAQAFAAGESTVSGAGELRVKESDRIQSTAEALRALGGEIETAPDGWTVRGRAGRPFRGGAVHSHGDHRIAMAFAVAGLAAEADVLIHDIGPVLTSDPGFFGALRRWQG